MLPSACPYDAFGPDDADNAFSPDGADNADNAVESRVIAALWTSTAEATSSTRWLNR
jgi:hypothetical protein